MPLEIVGDEFRMDGEPLRILSGAIHYFRVVPEYWRDRLTQLKACGLNTVETYVPWNRHEPRPGEYDFDGMLDIERFCRTAGELGLHAIVRPGPYICSEWDFGGLPSWLLADPQMRVRCMYPPYVEAVDRYFDALMERLAPLQATAGGPVIAMQVENEYGSFGSDSEYLAHLRDGMRLRGIDVPLFTSDGPSDFMLTGGTLPDVLKIANFGSGARGSFANLRRHQPTGPLMCGEFWNGWFDHWGDPQRTTRSAADAAAALDEILAAGGSVNFYMFHGGTNFGFNSGANYAPGNYRPDVTSYDYDAPVSESGEPTDKFYACRDVIAKYAPVPEIDAPPGPAKKAFGAVELDEAVRLFDSLDVLSTPAESVTPLPMEMLGQDQGLILYRATVRGPREELPVVCRELRDRALIFLDGEYRGCLYRNTPDEQVRIGLGPGEYRLDVLVENMGRINYGPDMGDRKGITAGVALGQQYLYHWTMFPIPLDDLSGLQFAPAGGSDKGDADAGPVFRRGHFEVDEPADTFLALPGWTKGVCWINGFNLGRYWTVGPQQTLYVPAPLLQAGTNELIVLELHDTGARTVELRDTPDLGPRKPDQ